MDFEDLTRRRLIYYPNAEGVLRTEISESRNAYATQRLLGNSEAAHSIRESLFKDLRQAGTELKGELAALSSRRKSVINALKILDEPIQWPLWPETNHLEHEEVMDDLMRVHRGQYRIKLERLKARRV